MKHSEGKEACRKMPKEISQGFRSSAKPTIKFSKIPYPEGKVHSSQFGTNAVDDKGGASRCGIKERRRILKNPRNHIENPCLQEAIC